MSMKYLVAIDGSDHGWRALDLAVTLAKATGAALLIVHVVPYEQTTEGLEEFGRLEGIRREEIEVRYRFDMKVGSAVTHDAEARARKAGLENVTTLIVEGKAANRIVALAETEGVDMVFIGSHGLGDIAGLLMGSVAHKVLHLVPCPCVVVK